MTGRNPTDRGKRGTKRHVLTEQHGIPLSVVITAANTHDMKSAAKTLDNIVIIKRRRRERIQASSSRLYKICVLTKDMTLKRLNMKLSKEGTYHIFDIEEKNRS